MAEKVAKNYEDAKTIAKQKQLENEKNNDKDKWVKKFCTKCYNATY